MAITLSTGSRNAACDAITALVDVSGPGTIEIKTAASTVAGTSEAATLTFPATAFGAAVTGVCTAGTIVDDTSAAGGTAGFYAVFDGLGAAVWQGTVTATSGGGDLELSSVVIGATDTVTISSFTITVPAA